MAAIYRFGPFRLDAGAGILFHGAEPTALGVYAAAGTRLARLIGQHIDAAERYLRLEATLVGTVDKDRQEHRALLDAALTGDVESAHQLIEQHVAGSGLRIPTLLRERGGTREKE